jgi:Putative peptidoglycan binding domain
LRDAGTIVYEASDAAVTAASAAALMAVAGRPSEVRMKGAFASATSLCLLAMSGPAAAEQIGCFSDGDFVYLHVGSTYQYYLDKGDQQVDCTPEAAKLGLELTEDVAQRLCAKKLSLCNEKKAEARLIRATYADLLRQAGYVEPPPTEESTTQAEAAGQGTAVQTAAKPWQSLNSRDTIRFVQKSLQLLGYDPGGVDGAMGKRTAAAIRKYEKDNGLRVTGKINKALVVSLQEKAGQPSAQ